MEEIKLPESKYTEAVQNIKKTAETIAGIKVENFDEFREELTRTLSEDDIYAIKGLAHILEGKVNS